MDRCPSVDDGVHALIPEVRQQTRRRRRWIGVAIVSALAVALLAWVGIRAAGAGTDPSSNAAAGRIASVAAATETCTSGSDPYFGGGRSLGGAVTVSAAYSMTISDVVSWDDSHGGNDLSYKSLPGTTPVTVCYLSGNFLNAIQATGAKEFHTEVVVIPTGGSADLDLLGPAQLPFGPPVTFK